MPRNVNIEQYKADQIYQAKLAELQGDRFRAEMHYRAAVDAARIQQDTELAKAKQTKELEEKKLKQSAAKSDLDSIIESRKALDTNSRLSENNRIQGYGVLAKLLGDSKMSNAEAEGVWAAIRKQKIKDPVTGKLRELDGKEQNEAFREIKARREMTPYADALGRMLGVGQMQEAAGIPAKDVYGNELGAPVNQPYLAKGQNWLNPTPPQDKSVPPQAQVGQTASVAAGGGAPAPQNVARPRQQAYMEGGLPTWLQQAGVPGAQAAEAEARFKQGGIQEVTNPTSTNYNRMVAKLAGIAPPKMTPEMEVAFQDFLAKTTGGNYDSQQYLEAKKAFMMDQGNWQKGGKGSKPPWMLYGSPEWENTGTSQALAEKDADWFKKMLPADEYRRMEQGIRSNPMMEDAAQGWNTDRMRPGRKMQVIGRPDLDSRTNVGDDPNISRAAYFPDDIGRPYPLAQNRIGANTLAGYPTLPSLMEPEEEVQSGGMPAAAGLFGAIANPHRVFGSIPSGGGALMPHNPNAYEADGFSPESGMNVDYDNGLSRYLSETNEGQRQLGMKMLAPFDAKKIWDAQGDMTRNAIDAIYRFFNPQGY